MRKINICKAYLLGCSMVHLGRIIWPVVWPTARRQWDRTWRRY